MRCPLTIGNNVIIGKDVEIITCSHNINSSFFELKTFGIIIENFTWIATRAFLLPSVRKVGFGSVIAAGSVVFTNVPPKSVISGNPARHLKFRDAIHSNLNMKVFSEIDFLDYCRSYLIK